MKYTEQEHQPCIEYIKMESAPKLDMFSSVDEIANSLSSNPQIEYNYSKKKIRETAKEMQWAAFCGHIIDETKINNTLTDEIVDEYLNLYVTKYPNTGQITRHYKQYFPERMWCLAEGCASYKVHANKPQRTSFEESIIYSNIRLIKGVLRILNKFDFDPRNEHLVEIAKDVLKDYNEKIKQKSGKKSKQQCIEMIDCETGGIFQTFTLRSEIINKLGVTKGTLSKIFKSVRENSQAKSKWRKVKYDGKKYWLCEKVIE